MLVEKILSLTVKKFNAGDFGKDYLIFQEKDFYRNIISQALTPSIANEFIDELRIERGFLQRNSSLLVIKLTLPHNNEIGDTVIACVVIDVAINHAFAYCMEKSLKGYMICEWSEGKHFNYGATANFSSFFSFIIAMAEEEFGDLNNKNKTHAKTNERSSFRAKAAPKKAQSSKLKGTDIAAFFAFLFFVGFIVLSLWLAFKYGGSKSVSDTTDKTTTLDAVYGMDSIREVGVDKEMLAHNEISSNNEECQGVDNIDDLMGETFVYNPEDGSICTSSGRIVSEGVSSEKYNDNKTSAAKPSKQNKVLDPYEGVEITHYLNGEYPYFDVYGRGVFDSKSLSSLGISNKTGNDAVVLLCNGLGEVIRNVYVKNGSFLELKRIPACKCIIKVMFGKDWYKGKDNGTGFPKGGFTKDISYTISKWSDAFDFIPQYVTEGIDYPTYEITLHSVSNGNFQTKSSNKNEFFNNKLGAMSSLSLLRF